MTTDIFGIIEQTGPNSFKADEHIIKSVNGAKNVHEHWRAGHLRRIVLYSEIDGLIAGNPPYDPKAIAAAGLTSSNFNDMSARAYYERACLAYWNLLFNSQYLVKFVLRIKDPIATEFALAMSRNWDYAIKKHWPSFRINLASLASQLVKFGVSPTIFSDERDPRWRVVELSRFFIPDQAQADLDMLTAVQVETEFTIQYLWQVYLEFKDKETSPWDTTEIGRLLLQVANTPIKDGQTFDRVEISRRLTNGDLGFDRMYNDSVRLISHFQKEYTGKISHYIFHRNSQTEQEFLFKQEDQYQEMSEALLIFTMNPGEFTIHGNRGMGHKIFSLAQAKIQADNAVVDMGKWASTPIIKSSSLNSKDVEQIRFYPGVPTNIGTAEFVQNTLGANVDNVIGVSKYLSQLIQFNIAYSGSDPAQPDPDQGSLSPSQVRLLAFKEFSVLKNNIMHFYATCDCLFQNMTGKMLHAKPSYPGYEIAETWKERCLDDQIPKEIFELNKTQQDYWGMPNHIEVYATRAAGAGSQVAMLMGLQELQAIAGSFGPREEKAFKRDFISATLGPEYLETYMQEGDDVDEKAGGASLAGVENAIMQLGKSPIFSADNEHRSHIVTHLALLTNIIQQVEQQQLDVVEADRVATVAVPHVGEHFQALSQSIFAVSFLEKTAPVFKQVNQWAALNHKNAQESLEAQAREQQQAEEKQQQVLSAEELKNLQVMNDEERKDIKLQAQSQRQKEAGDAKRAALFASTRAKIAVDRAKTVSDINVKRLAEAGKLRNEREKNLMEIANGADKPKSPSSSK